MLGDSYVAAWEVPVAETFHKLLEARLTKEDPLQRASYQVIAFGQGRTAQEAEIQWLRKYGPLFRPDMVVLLFFCGNDFMENDETTFAAASRFGKRYIADVAPRKIQLYQRLLWFPRSRLNGLLARTRRPSTTPSISTASCQASHGPIWRTRRSASIATRCPRSGQRPSTARVIS